MSRCMSEAGEWLLIPKFLVIVDIFIKYLMITLQAQCIQTNILRLYHITTAIFLI